VEIPPFGGIPSDFRAPLASFLEIASYPGIKDLVGRTSREAAIWMEKSLPKPRSTWIISPWADLICLVGAPLVIFPLALLASHHLLTPELLAVGVLAFASFGHHLPGFLRAYGDRDLFQRYFWRFVLAPPLVAAAVLSFAVLNLHGFDLILMVWATWHILMQTYGFLRIYDAKRGNCDAWSARLDFWACAAIFTNGILLSDARVYAFSENFALAGLPILQPAQLAAMRWIVGAATAALVVLYVVQLWRVSRTSSGMSWPKLLLLTTTGLFYWASGLLSTNLLVGVAMFEVFHAVQYFAVVWAYNRRVAQRDAQRLRPVSWLFRGGAWSLALYLCAIGLFGATFLAARSIDVVQIQQALLVLFSTSACLHFYYDGFIWKIRERGTRSDLNIDAAQAGIVSFLPGWRHALKWGVLGAVAACLAMMETAAATLPDADSDRLLGRLERLTPDVPELQVRLAEAALRRGDAEEAIRQARRAIDRRPQAQRGHAVLGSALLNVGRFAEAAASLQQASELGPASWEDELNLGRAFQSMRDFSAAESCYVEADRLAHGNAKVQHAWASLCSQNGDPTTAIRHYTLAINGYRRVPQTPESQADLADAIYQRGATKLSAGQFQDAQLDFQQTLDVQPNHALALLELGNAAWQSGDLKAAVARLERCVASDPSLCDGYNSLGAAFYDQGHLDKAAEAYARAIELRGDFAPSHFNLGLVHLERRNLADAKRCIERAGQLGQSIPPEIAAELGLAWPKLPASE
jgi:tetratricopeptide (TPR) repeat protein